MFWFEHVVQHSYLEL